MHEPDHELRVLSMDLWRRLDVPQARSALVRGLYDANGYVSKAAGAALIGYGKDIEPLILWALEDKGTQGPFYAMQVLATVGAPKAAAGIVPLLRDDDPKVRITAAGSLARLRAVFALPQIQAALENLPKDRARQEFYKAALGRAIAELKKLKEKGDK
jgi:HEAT repeat protein